MEKIKKFNIWKYFETPGAGRIESLRARVFVNELLLIFFCRFLRENIGTKSRKCRIMSGNQLARGVSFLDFLPQTAFVNTSEFLSYQNGSSSASTIRFPVLLASSDARNQSFVGSDMNNTFLQKKEINSFYFYKVSQY